MTLEALLTRAEEVPSKSNFEARLQHEWPLRRDRGSWVMLRVERGNAGWKVMVDEDLAHWILPGGRGLGPLDSPLLPAGG